MHWSIKDYLYNIKPAKKGSLIACVCVFFPMLVEGFLYVMFPQTVLHFSMTVFILKGCAVYSGAMVLYHFLFFIISNMYIEYKIYRTKKKNMDNRFYRS